MSPLRRSLLRRFLAVPFLSTLGLGCGDGKPADPASQESPEQTAARVFAIAKKLESEHKSRQAFAAYHQLSRQFPGTPEGKKAAERIRKAQQSLPSPRRR